MRKYISHSLLFLHWSFSSCISLKLIFYVLQVWSPKTNKECYAPLTDGILRIVEDTLIVFFDFLVSQHSHLLPDSVVDLAKLRSIKFFKLNLDVVRYIVPSCVLVFTFEGQIYLYYLILCVVYHGYVGCVHTLFIMAIWDMFNDNLDLVVHSIYIGTRNNYLPHSIKFLWFV